MTKNDEVFNYLLNMKIHDRADATGYFTVLRVPGGWIYYKMGASGDGFGVFVPEPKQEK